MQLCASPALKAPNCQLGPIYLNGLQPVALAVAVAAAAAGQATGRL